MKKILILFTSLLIACSSNEIKIEETDINNTINYNWWLGFEDDNLVNLIEKAINNNKDIKIALLKLKEYNRMISYYFGAELPTISASFGGYYNSKPIKQHSMTMMRKDGVVLPVSVNYELDYLGKNRNKTESIKKQVEVYKYQIQSMYLQLVTNVSSIYFNISKINQMIDLQKKLISLKANIIGSLNDKLDKQLISNLEINTKKQEIIDIEINISNLLKTKQILLNQLSVLIGEDVVEDIASTININNIKSIYIPEIISSDVIFSRPDVLAYEKQLEKNEIDIKIARKEFFPSINLSASVFFNNFLDSGGLFNPSNTIYSLLGGITQDLFVGGRKKANIDMAYIKYGEIFEKYEQVVLEATKEIMDSYISIFNDYENYFSNIEKYSLEIENYNKYKEMFKNGLITEFDLNAMEQKLILLKMEELNIITQTYIDYINLYQATAGNLRKQYEVVKNEEEKKEEVNNNN